MRIAVIGIGYVGLVVAAGFAENGNDVFCMDVDEKKIRDLKEGIVPIYEPGLEDLVKFNHREGRLRFGTKIAEAVEFGEVIFLALPTPPNQDGSADVSAVLSVADDIGKILNAYKIIVTKSTVPVGTADAVRERIAKHTKSDFDVVSNPEFLKEGAAVADFMTPDRVVIGTRSKHAIEVMQELYAPFLRTGKPFLTMDERSSEMTKYAANSFLAMKISFINEIANLCDACGADVDSVRIGMGTDERIGMQFLFPGPGFGGSCFPKDIRALIKTGDHFNTDLHLLRSVEKVNNIQKTIIAKKICEHFDGSLKGRTIAVWGLAFKPRTDDVRESPAIELIRELQREGASVRAYDPAANGSMKKILPDITYCENNYDALRDADAMTLMTEWNEFRRPDYERMKTLMKQPVIFDARNIFSPDKMRARGFTYYGIGRR
ncbi:MAG TPA: UDP-glucose/GDP-mannose dehydrogenase family protein [Candidatus Kapabacteria bacterium]|nr:UDP-glucose/GDP-mannose dehydrogenase family protein [Candidatus Kapabacteria bacterium]